MTLFNTIGDTTPGLSRRLVAKLDNYFYPDCEDRWDSKLFAERIRTKLEPGMKALDLGAGRGALPELDMRARGAHIAATDPDPVVLENPQVDESRVIDPDGRIPWPDQTFDIIYSSFVWEHVQDPVAFLSEARRVLRPGGVYLSLTPNRRHYIALAARLTPHTFHEWYNARRGRSEPDTFPTFHRLNCAKHVRRAACEGGFHDIAIETLERRPEYLRLNPPMYLAGIIYERAVNSTERLANFRSSLIVKATKH